MKLKNHCTVALNNIKEGIITMDADFKITYINPATSTLLKKPISKIKQLLFLNQIVFWVTLGPLWVFP